MRSSLCPLKGDLPSSPGAPGLPASGRGAEAGWCGEPVLRCGQADGGTRGSGRGASGQVVLCSHRPELHGLWASSKQDLSTWLLGHCPV